MTLHFTLSPEALDDFLTCFELPTPDEDALAAHPSDIGTHERDGQQMFTTSGGTSAHRECER